MLWLIGICFQYFFLSKGLVDGNGPRCSLSRAFFARHHTRTTWPSMTRPVHQNELVRKFSAPQRDGDTILRGLARPSYHQLAEEEKKDQIACTSPVAYSLSPSLWLNALFTRRRGDYIDHWSMINQSINDNDQWNYIHEEIACQAKPI